MALAKVDKWDGAITNDPYDTSVDKGRISTGFDISTNPSKLTPYRSSESGDASASTSQKQNFCFALRSGVYPLFSLGVVSGTGRAEVLYNSDASGTTWSTPANNQAASGSTSFNLFVYYKYSTVGNSRIFGASGGSRIWSFDPTSSAAFDDAGVNITYTNIAQGLVHSKDDILYIPYDNKIASNNQGSWNNTALTLPEKYFITSICEYGNYLAIACAPLSGVGDCVVYLWDRNASLATLSESINWGTGSLKVLENIEGYLVGVSLVGGNSLFQNEKIVFKYYNGNGAIKFQELLGTTSSLLPISKQKVNNNIYFLASIVIDGTRREGVWSISRKSSGGFAVNHERTPNNDTALSGGTLNGFIYAGDYLWQSFVTSATYSLTKTDDQANYTATAIRQTTINPAMDSPDRTRRKQLLSVCLTYEPLPTAGQVVLKYRVDGSAWTTIFTETTNSAVGTEVTLSEQFTEGRNYEFLIESTGGAEVVTLVYRYNVLNTLI